MRDDPLKKTIEVYDKIASSYAKQIEDYAPRLELEKFIKLLPKGGKIMDAGCGPGRDCAYFVKQGFDVIGIDLSEKLLEIARKRTTQAKFIKQDLRYLDFPDNSFDGIWANSSLHHLDRNDISKVLEKFHRILKPQGILLVIVKEGSGDKDVSESLSSGLPRHYVFYRFAELEDILTFSGFKILETYAWREEDRYPRDGRSELVFLSSFSKKP